MSEEAVRAYFGSRAAGYAENSARGLWAWQRRREAAALFALAGDLKGQRVLDLGCGTGYYALAAREAGAGFVAGMDAATAMVERLRLAGLFGIVGDAATTQAGDGFHLVIASGVLEFVSDPEAVLKNAARHMLPGGRVVILVPPDTLAGRLYRRFHLRNGFRIRLYSPASIAQAANAAGLKVAACRTVYPYSTIYRLDPA